VLPVRYECNFYIFKLAGIHSSAGTVSHSVLLDIFRILWNLNFSKYSQESATRSSPEP
jgi:hypothetical protein